MSATWIDSLKVHTIDGDREAAVALASVPLPREDHALVRFDGMASQAVPLAWYPSQSGAGVGDARQVLVMGVDDGGVGDELGFGEAEAGAVVDARSPGGAASGDGSGGGPGWRTRIVEEKKTGMSMREVNELRLAHAGRELGIRMGIELVDGGHHWWEWMQVERLWSGPICTAIRAAGYIGVTDVREEEMFGEQYNSGYWVHRHNWLFGEVTAQLFVNGLVKVTARHVNNRFFDQGQDLEGFVPIVAFDAAGSEMADTTVDGTCTDFVLGSGAGSVQLDIDRGTDIIGAAHPGRLRGEGDLVVYQGYEGTECLLGDGEPADRWNVRAEERRMWKGMARTVAFDLSFAEKPIRTRRYLPPWGWMGATGALWPDGMLPARGELDRTTDEVLEQNAQFEKDAGCVKPFCNGRSDQNVALFDGEDAHGLIRQAYRTGRRDAYEAALNRAYCFADVGIDHADFTHQIGGMAKGSISLVLHRNLGMLAAYLETGDPYLLTCAASLADNAYTIDRSNWPRRSYGRDGAYIRSMTRMYDVTGERHYLERAGEACRRAVQCQRADGSYADQGGTIGPHAHLNEIIKPWMNSILCEVFVDYLERAGSDAVVEGCLVKTADWLLTQVLEDESGGKYWPYQVAWGENEWDPMTTQPKSEHPRKHPAGEMQLDYNARTLLWLSRRTGEEKYGRTWQETYARHRGRVDDGTTSKYHSTYHMVKVPDNFPWHEAHLWGARWDGSAVTFDPMLELIEVGRSARIELPNGETVEVTRTEAGVERV